MCNPYLSHLNPLVTMLFELFYLYLHIMKIMPLQIALLNGKMEFRYPKWYQTSNYMYPAKV